MHLLIASNLNMKKISYLFMFLLVGSLVSFPASVRIVSAEDNGGSKGSEISNGSDHNDGGISDEEDDSDEDGQTNGEHDIYSFLQMDNQSVPSVNLPEVNAASINTYADVVTVLKSYDVALSQISSSAGVDTSNSNLSVTEKALLDSLVNKHKNQFNRLDSRILEVQSQIKQLEDLLLPLGTQPISSLYNIKDLLVGELSNYRDMINGISEFDSLNLQTLESETD